MLLNVVCFLSLGVCGWIVSLCSGCVGCCAFCLICDACSCKCWCIGSTLVSSCRCCVLVSCVHPVAILRAVFCTKRLVVVVDLPLLRVAVEGSDNPVSLEKPCQASLPPDQQGRHSLGRQPEVQYVA